MYVSAPNPQPVPTPPYKKGLLYLGNIHIEFKKDRNKTPSVEVRTSPVITGLCINSGKILIFVKNTNIENSANPDNYVEQPRERSNCIKIQGCNI